MQSNCAHDAEKKITRDEILGPKLNPTLNEVLQEQFRR